MKWGGGRFPEINFLVTVFIMKIENWTPHGDGDS